MTRCKRTTLLLLGLIASSVQLYAQKSTHSFEAKDGQFLLDGKPFQIISGEMHYTRIPKEYWRDRMQKAKKMGLNAIATYVFWNAHEPLQGQYDFSGNNDVESFLKIAKEEGLWVVLRPSPYVCSEWEFGGYPWWLLKNKSLKVRSKDPDYFNAYTNYITELGKRLGRYEVAKGGPVLMVQMENEYGFYGSDKEYLAMNRDLFRKAGFTGQLYTCDIPQLTYKGYLPGVLPAINTTPSVAKIKDTVNRYNGGQGPYFVAESYPGWYYTWGNPRKPPGFIPTNEKFLEWLDNSLKAGVSVNFYMFHGGTTRGFMNGANREQNGPFIVQTNCYDYFGPLDEAGNPTEKYYQYQKVITQYNTAADKNAKAESAKAIIIPSVQLSEEAPLFANLPKPVRSENPLCFEELNQAYGYVLYRTTLKKAANGILKINGLRDYAQIFINGKPAGVLDRRLGQDSIAINTKSNVQLDILVENLGRLNSGPYLFENRKGIIESVTVNNEVVKDWQQFGFPFSNTAGWTFRKPTAGNKLPTLKRGYFMLNERGDTYLDMRRFGKGHVWVNGKNLGRYWNIGPTQTMYVPAVWLQKGKNEVIVFEQFNNGINEVSGIDYPILDDLKK